VATAAEAIDRNPALTAALDIGVRVS